MLTLIPLKIQTEKAISYEVVFFVGYSEKFYGATSRKYS